MSLIRPVALRKESVDRNTSEISENQCTQTSLSARRAWIEIALASKENATKQSLSARRAWIEIRILSRKSGTGSVALRKESVDRNPDFRY